MTKRMSSRIVLIPFIVLTIYALMDTGYIGLLEFQLSRPAGWQVFFDLVLSLLFVMSWMIPEAKAKGRNPWPFFVLTLFMGVIGPLLYYATDKEIQQ